jgi:hypothetical protein
MVPPALAEVHAALKAEGYMRSWLQLAVARRERAMHIAGLDDLADVTLPADLRLLNGEVIAAPMATASVPAQEAVEAATLLVEDSAQTSWAPLRTIRALPDVLDNARELELEVIGEEELVRIESPLGKSTSMLRCSVPTGESRL